MSIASTGLQTPMFKAFIDIPAEKEVAGFASDKKPIASSTGLKGMLVSLFNSIASAISSKFSSYKAEQGTQAHQAFIGALKSEYGNNIGNAVSKRCGLDAALNSGKQLSGQTVQDAFKTAESLNQSAKFEQLVLQTTPGDDRFQALCKEQGLHADSLSGKQCDTFDDLVRDSGLLNRDTGAVGNKAPNLSLLIEAQKIAIRIATLPDNKFDHHLDAAKASIDTQLFNGTIDNKQADEMLNQARAAGRTMEFATAVHTASVGAFLENIKLAGNSGTGTLARDLLVLAKTQNAVCNAMADIRTAIGKTTQLGADELAVINETALQKALLNLPTGTTAYREMQQVVLMAKDPKSALCRMAGVLENIISQKTHTSDQNQKSGGIPQRGAASAWSIANTLIGLAAQEAQLSRDEIDGMAFSKGEGMETCSPADNASVLAHVNAFVKF